MIGFDYHEGSIAHARRRAQEAGLADRLRFEVARADGFRGSGYDLITCFDCLYDMGDPVSVARHVRGTLAQDGVRSDHQPPAQNPFEHVHSVIDGMPRACSRPKRPR